MSDQEIQPEYGDFDSDALNLLAMLNLNSTSAPAATTFTTASANQTPVYSTRKCTDCALSKKRRSPSSSSSLRRAFSKRATLHPSTTTTSPAVKIPLFFAIPPPPPPPPPTQSSPITETTQISDSSKAQVLNSLTAGSTQFLNTLSPENSENDISLSKSTSPVTLTSLPPLPPPLRRSSSDPISLENHHFATATAPPSPLRRSSSDPIPSENYQVITAAATPPRPPAATRTFSRYPSPDQASPNSKRLKRMKERMKEMTEWCHQVMNEEDDSATEDNNTKCEYENETGEAVWVDQIEGGGLIIHFKCPCGEGYEILLSGNTCYYKLM